MDSQNIRSERGFGDVAYGESGLWVIAGAGSDGEVRQIDLGTSEVLRRIPLANPSFWNEIAVGDDAVWVTSSPDVHQDGTPLVHLYRIDPSTGDVTGDVASGDGASGLGPDEGAASYSGVALGDGSVWTLVSFEDILLDVGGGDLAVRESLHGIGAGGSGVGPGRTIGAGSIWIAGSNSVTRVSLEA